MKNPVFKICEYVSLQQFEETGIQFNSKQEALDYASKATFRGCVINESTRKLICNFSTSFFTML
ncbi:MAG: hypothetical protein RIS29_2518 [Bacteroidota bacterium]|jgi:hypothetical protein